MHGTLSLVSSSSVVRYHFTDSLGFYKPGQLDGISAARYSGFAQDRERVEEQSGCLGRAQDMLASVLCGIHSAFRNADKTTLACQLKI